MYCYRYGWNVIKLYQKVSQENKEAIRKAQAQGIKVVVATGRSYQEVRFVLDEADLHCPVICVNGAEVRTKEGDIYSATPIEEQCIKAAEVVNGKGYLF